MKQGIGALRDLRNNVRMISGPSYIYGDNMSGVHNTSRPESVLRKEIQFAIMQFMSHLQWESPWLDTYLTRRILQIQ